jgi:hypothetical protein
VDLPRQLTWRPPAGQEKRFFRATFWKAGPQVQDLGLLRLETCCEKVTCYVTLPQTTPYLLFRNLGLAFSTVTLSTLLSHNQDLAMCTGMAVFLAASPETEVVIAKLTKRIKAVR